MNKVVVYHSPIVLVNNSISSVIAKACVTEGIEEVSYAVYMLCKRSLPRSVVAAYCDSSESAPRDILIQKVADIYNILFVKT